MNKFLLRFEGFGGILVLVRVDDKSDDVIGWRDVDVFFDVVDGFDDWIRFLFVVISSV